MARTFLLGCLLVGSVEILAQPEARIYADIFEIAGVSAGYSVKRTRFELSGSFRSQDVPANDYVSYTVGLPSQGDMQLVQATFVDNTWKKNTTTLTTRIVRSGKKERKWFGLYYGLYLRYLNQHATADKSDWSTTDHTTDATYRIVESNKIQNVFGGLLFGARGKISGKFFWDANVGLKLIPWFYWYNEWTYNDGTSELDAYQSAGYQYAAPGDTILQLGVGYKFSPKKE